MILAEPADREQWLKERKKGIGASEAGAVLGLNRYKTAISIWQEKLGMSEEPDLSGNKAVQFGNAAEPYLRELFVLTYPQYTVEYHAFRMYARSETPWLFATLDGELTETETGRRGILEIKTTEVKQAAQWKQWNDRVPDSYYAQMIHQLLACEWAEFVELFAHIRYWKNGSLSAVLRHYHLEREDVADDLDEVLTREAEFWEHLQSGEEPPVILPDI